MKKLLLASLTLNACLFVGLLFRAGLATAQAANSTSACGDVNSDGKIDIADPVHLLTWLFSGGADPMCRTGPLPATGQTVCSDVDGAVIDCASDTRPGQNGFYATGCPSEGRFVDNEDGTVTDTCTGLMWQQDSFDLSGDGVVTNPGDGVAWSEALAYCENLVVAGHDDWRLPNVRELQSIVDYGRYGTSIDPILGTTLRNSHILGFWSSTSLFRDSARHLAWIVDLIIVGNVLEHDSRGRPRSTSFQRFGEVVFGDGTLILNPSTRRLKRSVVRSEAKSVSFLICSRSEKPEATAALRLSNALSVLPLSA